jgi:hypothetical protein
MSEIVDQPPPAARPDLIPAWEQVIADYTARYTAEHTLDNLQVVRDVLDDMTARDATGRERYGVPLTAHNGRDQLVDAYQEALDLAVYLRAAMEEGHQVHSIYENTLRSITTLRDLINARGKKS